MNQEVRTRFAPSPTGFMHLGGLRAALYGYLFARKNGGKFILRIEDTDQVRFVEGATEVIYDTLRRCGMNWDEGPDVGGPVGPYIQSQRKDLYLPYAQQLVKTGHAYYCFCTKEELEERRAACEAKGEVFKYDKHCLHLTQEEIQRKLDAGVPYVIRQNAPTTGETSYDDLVFGHMTFPNDTLDDMVLIKQDGMPTYNFANVIDDHLMGITHVMRGMEYLSSTPKYNLLYEAFGWEIPQYIHMPPVMRDSQHKLSKRDGDASFEDFRAKGYLTEAILNYILLLGWAPKGEQEIFTLDEMIEAFDLSGISKSPAIFDPLKLTAINAVYIRNLPLEKFIEYAEPWIRQTCRRTDIDMPLLCAGLQPRTEVFNDIPERVDFIDQMPEYSIDMYVSKKMKTTPQTSLEALKKLIPVIEGIQDFTTENIHDALFKQIEADGVKNGLYLYPLRVALSGKAVTPGGGVELAKILGKQDTLDRMHKAVGKLTAEIG